MNHRHISKGLWMVAGLTVAAYLALVVLASGCLFMHAAPAGGHDHHAKDSTHSPLCAWSCQALSGGGLIAEPPVVMAWPVEQAADLPASGLFSSVVLDLLNARAPPQSILS